MITACQRLLACLRRFSVVPAPGFSLVPASGADDLVVLFAVVTTLFGGVASAEPVPVWKLTATSQTTNFTAAEANDGRYPLYSIVATNVGGGPTTGPFTVTATLPEGIIPTVTSPPSPACEFIAPVLTCTISQQVLSGQNVQVEARVKTGPPLAEGSPVTAQVKISGGGALDASTSTTTQVTSELPEFGFLPGPSGISAMLNGPDGSPVTLAGSHPAQLTVDLGFPSRRLGGEGEITGAGGGLRDLTTNLPRGFMINPTATPVLCSEAQLEGHTCPNEAAVGIVTVLTTGAGTPQPSQSPLYNMVPPAGTAGEFGFDAAGVGIFVHLKGGVRSDGDYGLFGTTNDTLARAPNPALGAQAQLWGDPSDKSHDHVRGECDEQTGKETEPGKGCLVGAQETAFLTLPTACSESLGIGAAADSWTAPGKFATASAPVTDAAGVPSGVDGCGALAFKPTVSARPTTNLTGSPSGLDFSLRQPQESKLGGHSTAALRDATVSLPEGMAVNPSSAGGQGVCTPAQVGLTTKAGESPIRFTKAPAGCPGAARIGSLQAATPLLAQIDAATNKPLFDPQGNAIPRPLEGSVYLAQPFQNPFGSLLAIYLVIEDPQSGTVAKVAARVHADPATGQLSTTVTENPQLPLEEIALHLFKGPRAPLRTPPACGTYTTTSALTPWSAPEGKDEHPSDSFQITAAPGGGPCPASAPAAPNSPGFEAGTISPQAGTYTPLALKLSREDGSQQLQRFEATLPPGLAAKLAGVPYCPEAAIAQAQARSHPNEGALEQADPSCPAASEVGSVDAAAGAGPSPLHVPGRIYLAGPYKGAPLSAVIITPAVAGPFDLGTVVVRAAISLDPVSARARTVSDPFPTVLEGIPLDLRSAAVRLGRPQFTLNPTSCDELSFSAAATSVFGQVAPLSERFQAGGCKELPFKPKLALRLFGPIHRGGHPRLRAVLTARPGEAGIARTAVTLPRSEFIDQAHFRTICTRVQFAAGACPAGSVYGQIKATSPLVDYTLEGPVYLRSSSHELPDVVAVLRGPPSQPLQLELAGRVDSVNGGLRTTFEALPDAPVKKAIVTLQGGKKGLFQNSTNICKGTFRATVAMRGQNAKPHETRPAVRADCPKAKQGKSGKRH